MSRVQLALNVRDVDEAVDFYRKLFGAEPAKREPGYANFAIADPPLKLVLLANPAAAGTMNHLGVEVGSGPELAALTERMVGTGLLPVTQTATTCCYAVADKAWVHDPDGAAWEAYTVLADAPSETGLAGDGDCCCTFVDAARAAAGAAAGVGTAAGAPGPVSARGPAAAGGCGCGAC